MIVETQFGISGSKPWFIRQTPGELFITKEAEAWPIVRKVYLPNCQLVGPSHTVTRQGNTLVVHDEHVYDDREVTDDEFRRLREQARRG